MRFHTLRRRTREVTARANTATGATNEGARIWSAGDEDRRMTAVRGGGVAVWTRVSSFSHREGAVPSAVGICERKGTSMYRTLFSQVRMAKG